MFVITNRRVPATTLFPYTTLFRSRGAEPVDRTVAADQGGGATIADHRVIFDPHRHGTSMSRRDSPGIRPAARAMQDRKSTRLNSSHRCISYAVFCLKKKKKSNYLN